MANPPPSRAATNDTIFACSSGRQPAAIAIVRVSGPRAGEVLEAMAGRRPPPRHATLARLRDERGDLLDRALTLWFPGPDSATGEDLAELHVHGGVAVVDAVLADLGERAGLRPAEPGEFTRRALLNGRLDLAEAEALADLLEAETEYQRREALRRVEGAIGRRLRGWADRLVGLCAMAEVAIDYEDEAAPDIGELASAIDTLRGEIEAALATPPAERLRNGVRVAIVGPPNAGKSSLFNALLGQSAAIVSPEAGTTRDVIERPVSIDGVPLVLVDTAGLRDAEGAIEQEGIARARREAEAADLLLDLHPGAAHDEARIAVSTRIDIRPAAPRTFGVSNVTLVGVRELADAIVERAKRLLPADGEVAWTRRYREALGRIVARLASARAMPDSVLTSEELRQARVEMDRLIGGADVEAVLDALFGRFCLGK